MDRCSTLCYPGTSLPTEHQDRGVKEERRKGNRHFYVKVDKIVNTVRGTMLSTLHESYLAQDIFESTSSANAGTLTLQGYSQVPVQCERVTPGNA